MSISVDGAAVVDLPARHHLEPLEPRARCSAGRGSRRSRRRRRCRARRAGGPRRASRTSCRRRGRRRGRRAAVRGPWARCHGLSLHPRPQRRHGEVELEHVDPRLAEEARGRGRGVLGDQSSTSSTAGRSPSATRATCSAAYAGEMCGSRPGAGGGERVRRAPSAPVDALAGGDRGPALLDRGEQVGVRRARGCSAPQAQGVVASPADGPASWNHSSPVELLADQRASPTTSPSTRTGEPVAPGRRQAWPTPSTASG